MISVAFIDRILDSAIRHHADAVAFGVGDRPRFYLGGKSMPISRPGEPLEPADLQKIVSTIFPQRNIDELETGRTSFTFNYGAQTRFVAVAERSSAGDRIVFWRHCSG